MDEGRVRASRGESHGAGSKSGRVSVCVLAMMAGSLAASATADKKLEGGILGTPGETAARLAHSKYYRQLVGPAST